MSDSDKQAATGTPSPSSEGRPTARASGGSTAGSATDDGGRGLLERHPWLGYVLPLAVFMLVTSFEPKPPAANEPAEPGPWTVAYRYYPIVYTIKLAATLAAMAFVARTYRQFPWRVSPLAAVVGIAGAAVWIGLSSLGLEKRVLETLGLGSMVDLGQRSGFNPLAQMRDNPALAYAFLGVRFLGLAVVVPIIEEFFLRGFLMRFFVRPDWWNVPFGTVNTTALLVGTLVPVLMHPAEMLAAAVWFSAVTWLMLRTRNIWDCVVAHALTNLLLGVYVVGTGEWQLL